jgi:hypothetical protein
LGIAGSTPASATNTKDKTFEEKERIMKYNLKGLNIFVSNESESNFVLKLAKKCNYHWRSYSKGLSAQSKRIYNKGKGKNGEFMYCFDYNEDEVGIISCFDYCFGTLNGAAVEEIKKEIEEIPHIKAKELMNMNKEELEVFLIFR